MHVEGIHLMRDVADDDLISHQATVILTVPQVIMIPNAEERQKSYCIPRSAAYDCSGGRVAAQLTRGFANEVVG